MTEFDTHEILSALLDRDPVDPDRLAALLERPEARALLVDFVRLRGILHADSAEVRSGAAPGVQPRRSIARPLLGLAAALLLVSTGVLVGSRFASADDGRPPEPTRVIRLSPASGGAR
jgi:hypothetical protein